MPTKTGFITTDEEPTKFNKKKIFKLKPVFGYGNIEGTITGANASKINDGACSFMLMSESAM